MAKPPASQTTDKPIQYPDPPHEFLVPSRLLDHLSQATKDELKSLAETGKIKFVD